MARGWPFTVVLVCSLAGLARAQDPPCPEFALNTHTTGSQFISGLASDASGNFVVGWSGQGPGGTSEGAIARLFSPAGLPLGPEFRVSATGGGGDPAVAFDASGKFVVAWSGSDGSYSGVFARRFSGAGAPEGPEVLVNTYTTGSQIHPAVAADPAGNFVVVWEDRTGGHRIVARRFDSSGEALGPEFQVSSSFYAQRPNLSMDGAGRFVVVWGGFSDGGDSHEVFGRRYDAAGVAQGPEFQVNTYTTDLQGESAYVASDPGGAFIVVWTSEDQDGDGYGVYGQRFDVAGTPLGTEFRVNTYTTRSQTVSSVASDGHGGFLVGFTDWVSVEDIDVYVRQFAASGAPRGPEFRVNTYRIGLRAYPLVAATPAGGFVVAWGARDQDGSSWGVFGSLDCTRLYTVSPCRLVDTRQPPGLPLQANSSRSFAVSGACGIPADARAVALNVTAVSPTDLGNLRLYPAGEPPPLASALNFVPGRTRANNAVVPLGTNGQVTLSCDMPVGSAGSTHLALDVYGYFKR